MYYVTGAVNNREWEKYRCIYDVLRNILVSFESKVSAGWTNRFHTILPCFVTVLTVLDSGKRSKEEFLNKYTLLWSSFWHAPVTLLVHCSSGVKSSQARLVAKLFVEQLFDRIMAVFRSLRCWSGIFNKFDVVEGIETMVLFYHTRCSTWWHCVVSGFASLVCSEWELRVCFQIQVWSNDQCHYQGVAVVVELEK